MIKERQEPLGREGYLWAVERRGWTRVCTAACDVCKHKTSTDTATAGDDLSKREHHQRSKMNRQEVMDFYDTTELNSTSSDGITRNDAE